MKAIIIQRQIKCGGSMECMYSMTARRLGLSALLLFAFLVAGCGGDVATEARQPVTPEPYMSPDLSAGQSWRYAHKLENGEHITITILEPVDSTGALRGVIRLNGSQGVVIGTFDIQDFESGIVNEPDWIAQQQAGGTPAID